MSDNSPDFRSPGMVAMFWQIHVAAVKGFPGGVFMKVLQREESFEISDLRYIFLCF
ncbi:hypothetical protein AAFO90_24255 [Phaeobacter sp. CAU 1743]|uniref:hypothetical protein n=1 Tax=Phaeobacter sp. CAU 1743 TaxID=3140367 RepID=UPI00325BC9E0